MPSRRRARELRAAQLAALSSPTSIVTYSTPPASAPAKKLTGPLPDGYGIPSKLIPSFLSDDGKTIRRQYKNRYEVVAADAPTVVLAVAQFHQHGPDPADGPGFPAWVVSGETSDLYTGPIRGKRTMIAELDARAGREVALYEKHPDTYPYVPEEDIEERDRIPGPQHLPN